MKRRTARSKREAVTKQSGSQDSLVFTFAVAFKIWRTEEAGICLDELRGFGQTCLA